MSIPNNPQSVYNGMMSGYRNMFLISSIGFAMIGFSGRFDNKNAEFIIKSLGASMLVLSLMVGRFVSYEFKKYMEHYKGRFPEHICYKTWYKWTKLYHIYKYILGTILGLFVYLRLVNKMPKK